MATFQSSAAWSSRCNYNKRIASCWQASFNPQQLGQAAATNQGCPRDTADRRFNPQQLGQAAATVPTRNPPCTRFLTFDCANLIGFLRFADSVSLLSLLSLASQTRRVPCAQVVSIPGSRWVVSICSLPTSRRQFSSAPNRETVTCYSLQNVTGDT